jgi:hypothetical protein
MPRRPRVTLACNLHTVKEKKCFLKVLFLFGRNNFNDINFNIRLSNLLKYNLKFLKVKMYLCIKVLFAFDDA